MKKIQVQTVRQTADIEVLFINANLISKVIKANIAIEDIMTDAVQAGCIKPEETIKKDANGGNMVDSDGNYVTEPMIDENGMQMVSYDHFSLCPQQLKAIAEAVSPLLTELVAAFEA